VRRADVRSCDADLLLPSQDVEHGVVALGHRAQHDAAR
jgi:hypothetical protein